MNDDKFMVQVGHGLSSVRFFGPLDSYDQARDLAKVFNEPNKTPRWAEVVPLHQPTNEAITKELS